MKFNSIQFFSIKINYELGRKTWFGSGGHCSFFLKADNLNQLKTALKLGKKFLPIFILGGGSNILVRDGGFKGLVIKLGADFTKINFDEKKNILSIGAAAKDLDVSKFCFENRISGFEFLSGIPGTIGGNLKMNAGCFGDQICDKLLDCTILDTDQNLKKLEKKQLIFKYRKSSFSDKDIIIEARFSAKKSAKEKIKKKMLEISQKRKKTQPVSNRTGGSTFINPPSNSAWKLIDAVKLRGKKIGGARVSKLHSNFLINENLATSMDLELLGEEIRRRVWNKFKIKLNWELMRIGEFKKI